MAQVFDSQGHRGARGAFPENTLPSFEEALRQNMRTLELDLVLSKDKILVVSHEPWFNPKICQLEGSGYDENTSLYSLTYEEIAKVDCGSMGNLDFPDQTSMPVSKPTLAAVVSHADSMAKALGRELPYYNLELKSEEDHDDIHHPKPPEFARLALDEIKRLGIFDRANVQSFDPRPLQVLHQMAPDLKLAFLSATPTLYASELEELGFKPEIYSPYHLLLHPVHVEELHAMGIAVIPWTVNDKTRMETLIDWGVDGIITDYPNRLRELLEAGQEQSL